jgi:hypothetical protein
MKLETISFLLKDIACSISYEAVKEQALDAKGDITTDKNRNCAMRFLRAIQEETYVKQT